MGARFEAFENVITKHEVNQKVNFQQIAWSSFKNKLNKKNYSIVRVNQINPDTIEIIKRRDAKRTYLYKLGFD